MNADAEADTTILGSVARQLLGDDWAGEDPARILAELAVRYADPAEVRFHLDAALTADENPYSADDTVDEIIRVVLANHADGGSIGLQSFQAIVRRVAGVRQPATVKRYMQDAVQDGPLRHDPRSINRFIIEDEDRSIHADVAADQLNGGAE